MSRLKGSIEYAEKNGNILIVIRDKNDLEFLVRLATALINPKIIDMIVSSVGDMKLPMPVKTIINIASSDMMLSMVNNYLKPEIVSKFIRNLIVNTAIEERKKGRNYIKIMNIVLYIDDEALK